MIFQYCLPDWGHDIIGGKNHAKREPCLFAASGCAGSVFVPSRTRPVPAVSSPNNADILRFLIPTISLLGILPEMMSCPQDGKGWRDENLFGTLPCALYALCVEHATTVLLELQQSLGQYA